jgi:dTDP-4-amino-4,6-dideoxygalactose transaminase
VTRIAPGARVDRNGVMRALYDAGVSTRPGTHAVTDLGSFRGRFAEPIGGCVTATSLESSTIALPLHGRMSDDDYDHVVEQLEVAAP